MIIEFDFFFCNETPLNKPPRKLSLCLGAVVELSQEARVMDGG